MRALAPTVLLGALAWLPSCQILPRSYTEVNEVVQRADQIDVGRTTREQLATLYAHPAWVEFLDFGKERLFFKETVSAEEFVGSTFDLAGGVVQDKYVALYRRDSDGVVEWVRDLIGG